MEMMEMVEMMEMALFEAGLTDIFIIKRYHVTYFASGSFSVRSDCCF